MNAATSCLQNKLNLILVVAMAVGGCTPGPRSKEISIVGSWYPSFGSSDQASNKPDPANGVLVFNENHTFELRQGIAVSGRWQQSGRNITLDGFRDNYFAQAKTGQGAGPPNMNFFLADDGKSMVDPSNDSIRFVRGRTTP